jgi:hypothetical protein
MAQAPSPVLVIVGANNGHPEGTAPWSTIRYASPPLRASDNASIAAPRAPAVSPFGMM